jgi:hypothetical protein
VRSAASVAHTVVVKLAYAASPDSNVECCD